MSTQTAPTRKMPALRPLPNPRNAIRRIREHHGLSLKQMGEIAGLSLQHLSLLEHGRYDPRVRVLCRLSHHFGYTIEQILDPDFDPKNFA